MIIVDWRHQRKILKDGELWVSRKKWSDVPGSGEQDGRGHSQVNKGVTLDFAKDGEEMGLPRAEEG